MRTHSRKLWPWFAADAVLAVIGIFVLSGVAAGIVCGVAFIGFFGACIYGLRGEKVYDGPGGIGGPLG
jgi:hypothetical protein